MATDTLAAKQAKTDNSTKVRALTSSFVKIVTWNYIWDLIDFKP
jgi:hypothetical protein